MLYNNASMPKFAPFAQQSDEDYLFTIQNELDLVWHACQGAWPHLAAVGGAIVNIGSGAGIQGARALPQAAHAAAKGAVIALTRQLAAEGIAVGSPRQLREPRGHGDSAGTRDVRGDWARTHRSRPIVERTIDGKPGIRSPSRMQASTWPPTRRNGSPEPTSSSTAGPAR